MRFEKTDEKIHPMLFLAQGKKGYRISAQKFKRSKSFALAPQNLGIFQLSIHLKTKYYLPTAKTPEQMTTGKQVENNTRAC